MYDFDNICECEYCCNEGKDTCWYIQKIKELKEKIEKLKNARQST